MHFPYIPDATGAPDVLSAHPARVRLLTKRKTEQLPIRLNDLNWREPNRSSRSREHPL